MPGADGSTQIRKDLDYYSHVRFLAVQTGTSPNFTETFALSAPLRAFGFAKGEDMGPAGRAGTNAADCDTNILTKGETLDGEDVIIFGVKVQVTGESDGFAATKLLRNVSTRISLNGGDRSMLLGNVEMLPGGNGFFASTGVSPSTGLAVPAISNGWPDDANAKWIKSGILWQHKGETDSNLVVLLNLDRSVAYTVANASAVAPNVDLRVQLVCSSVAPRSPNL